MMTSSNHRSTRFRYRKWMLIVAVLAVLLPRTLQTVQSVRETARRGAMKGGRDPAEDFKKLTAMRELYPIVPLGDRVAKPARTDSATDADPTSRISSDAERQLGEYEKASSQSVWSNRLRPLHDDAYAEFVKRNGFGESRMWYTLDWGEMRSPTTVPPPLPIEEPSTDASTGSLVSHSEPSPADLMHLPSLHANSVFDFVSPSRLGIVPEFDVASISVTRTRVNRRVIQDWSRIPADSDLHPLSVCRLASITHRTRKTHDLKRGAHTFKNSLFWVR